MAIENALILLVLARNVVIEKGTKYSLVMNYNVQYSLTYGEDNV